MSVTIIDQSTSRSYDVNLVLRDTVSSLKERLSNLHSIPVDGKELFFRNQPLMNDAMLSSVGICAGEKLLLAQSYFHNNQAKRPSLIGANPSAAVAGGAGGGYGGISIASHGLSPHSATSSLSHPRRSVNEVHPMQVHYQNHTNNPYAASPLTAASHMNMGMMHLNGPIMTANTMTMPSMTGPVQPNIAAMQNAAAMQMAAMQSMFGMTPSGSGHTPPNVNRSIGTTGGNAGSNNLGIVTDRRSSNPFEDVERALSRKLSPHPIADYLYQQSPHLDKEREYLDSVRRKLERSKTAPIKVKNGENAATGPGGEPLSPIPTSPTDNSSPASPRKPNITVNTSSSTVVPAANSDSHRSSFSSSNSNNANHSHSLSFSTSPSSLPPHHSSLHSTLHKRVSDVEAEKKEIDEKLQKFDEESIDKIKQLQLFISHVEAERSLKKSQLEMEKLKFEAKFDELKQKMKEEEEKTEIELAPVNQSIHDINEKIMMAEKKLSRAKEDREDKKKKLEEEFIKLRQVLGSLSAGRDGVEYEGEKEKTMIVTTICDLLAAYRIDNDVWTALNQRREKELQQIVERTTGVTLS